MKNSFIKWMLYSLWMVAPLHAQRDAQMYYSKAMEFVHLHEYKTAVLELDLAISSDPSFAEAYRERARLKLLLGEYTQASIDYQKALEISLSVWTEQASVHELIEEHKGFVYVYKSGSLHERLNGIDNPSSHSDTSLYTGKAYIHFSKGNYKLSEKYALKALSRDSLNGYCYYLLGSIYEAEGNYATALSFYSKNIEQDSLFYLHYYKRASVYKKMGDYKSALSDLQRAESLYKSCEYIYYNRAMIYEKMKDYPLALQDLNTALEIRPTFAEAYFNRAYIKKQLGDYKGAVEDVNAYISFRQNDALAFNNRGNLKMTLGDPKGAREDYDKAISLDGQLGIAYFNRGVSCMISGYREEACNDFTTSAILGNEKAKKKHLLHCY